MSNLHGGGIGGKCRLAKETIASGFGAQIDGGYGAYRHSVFLKGLQARFLSGAGAITRESNSEG
jgi:hypothetical protein